MTYLNWLKNVFTGDGSDNTPEGALIRAGGKHATKTITLSANNTSANVNVFQVTGMVEVTSIHAEVVDATTLTNCTDVAFDLWDGTLSTALTKASPGGVLSGVAVGTGMVKTAIASTLLTVLDNATGVLQEVAGIKVAQAFYVVKKNGADTFIRFNYTTTDAPINAQIKVDIVWADIDSGTIVAA